MKKIFFILTTLAHLCFAQDSLVASNTVEKENSTAITYATAPVEKLSHADFKKFYIGFTSSDNSLEVITLDINETESADSSITFYYTLNTKDTREEGVGEIWPDQSLIRFQNLEEGHISVPEDGKIEFESVTQDSVNYWKLKEK